MKLTFLGTSAGETYPGIWCDCPHCRYARQHGGKNIRSNSCALLDDVLLLDMGHACADSATRLGRTLDQVEMLLVTHPHPDHLYPRHLHWRYGREALTALSFPEQMRQGGPRFTKIAPLTIYGNGFTEEILREFIDKAEQYFLRFVKIQEGIGFAQNGYTVTPVRGNHHQRGFAHSYIIEKDGRKMLYALDTGYYEEDMEELLKQHVFNLIVMEGTGGLNSVGDGHMCLEKNVAMLDFFIRNGCYAKDGRFVLTHMSPHWTPPHDFYVNIAEKEGMIVAFDGMEIQV